MIDTKSLRKNLLSLAVTGKLTEQSEKDTPLSDDLNEYIPKMDIELPEIPMNWKYCKFDKVLINRDSERIPVSVADRKKLDKVYDYYGASGVIDKVDSYLFDETLLLIGEDGANLLSRSTPIAFLAHGKYWVNNHAHVLASTKHILLEYAEIVINSMSLVPFVTGAAQPKLSQNMMNKIAIPVPPLEEQQRIVDVVKESFKILDIIDELQRAYLSDVEVLKSKLIDAGIQGKLTEQLSEDGTAEELFAEIQAEEQRLIKEKKVKKEKALADISEDEIPFEIPNNWKWVRLEGLTANINIPMADGPFGSNLKKEHYTEKQEVRIIQLSNVGQDGWKNENVKYTTFEHLKTIGRSAVNAGEIVIAKMMPAGRAIIVPDIEEQYVLSSDCVKFVPHPKLLTTYINYAINSDMFRKQVLGTITGVGRERTSLSKLKYFLIPIPPYAEQVRIVEKLDSMLQLI